MNQDMFSTTEAYTMLGVSRRTFTYWIAEGSAVPSWTAPGPKGHHSWTLGRLRQIARTHGRTLNEPTP